MRALLLVAAALTACRRSDVERFIDTSSGKVYVRSRVRGEDLVLLHGLGDCHIGWRKVEEPLRREGYRVTVWDALGAGRSSKPDGGDYTLSAHVDRLAAVLDELSIEKVTFVANSLGGSMALLFARRHPDRVVRLVLISPAAYPEGGWTGTWFWESPLARALDKIDPALLAKLGLFMNYGNRARISEEDIALYTAEAARPGAIAAFVRQQQQLMPEPAVVRRWIAGYGALDIPTLILWGTRDHILDPAQGKRLARDLPQAKLVELRGVGHAAQLEAPDQVVAEILSFLERH